MSLDLRDIFTKGGSANVLKNGLSMELLREMWENFFALRQTAMAAPVGSPQHAQLLNELSIYKSILNTWLIPEYLRFPELLQEYMYIRNEDNR